MRGYHSCKIAYRLSCAIMTCHILYRATSNKIEQKTEVRHDIVRKIVIRIIERAGCKDIYEVFACVEDLNRSGRISRIADCTELSQNIQNAIQNNPKLKPHEAVINNKNITIPEISEVKKPARSIIKNVQFQHSHHIDGQEIEKLYMSIKKLSCS